MGMLNGFLDASINNQTFLSLIGSFTFTLTINNKSQQGKMRI